MPLSPGTDVSAAARGFASCWFPTVVFSDLDGTLLDPVTYRFDAAQPALEILRSRGVPLVLCSSKTRREIEVYRERLGNRDPFIFENGGGICVPAGLFPFPIAGEAADDSVVIPLGTPYENLRGALAAIRSEFGVAVTGFGDLSAAGVAQLTGLPLVEADLARRREFDEPFVFDDPSEPRETEFLRAIDALGLRWTHGRFYHILGTGDKGLAAHTLAGYYRRVWPSLRTVGIGDEFNDLPLLGAVDVPVLVQRRDGSYVDIASAPGLVRAQGAGPEGWNRAILEMFGS